ncbi:NmrA family NAD(P)-binding protein [Brachybacterium atlanticum]|uniref:NmrA family NAD(P)-binding protein n=1 Tax=Brachybacterium atlanticum TaxID=2911888 RepID=UPI0021E0145E|nr:NmrA family NAD(P)-binding protein [Brachybacterium atlanticum]
MTSGTILVIGATGGVGRPVVRCAVEAGLHPRALVRSTERAVRLLPRRRSSSPARRRCPWTWRARPGWFDDEAQDEHQLVARQGDGRHGGSPADGAISREQLARVLLAAHTTADATGLTLEVVAERGPEQSQLDSLFAGLRADVTGEVDGALDPDTLPLGAEPDRMLEELRRIAAATEAHGIGAATA